MEPRIIPAKKKPESILQDKIILMLERRKWLCMSTHGNMYQMGFPDIFCAHFTLGSRWVEVKIENRVTFTPAQMRFFPLLNAHGVGVWILTDNTEDQYQRLFRPQNWFTYLT